MKKKIIILIINKHIGEIDWILPLLYKIKNKYNFITIFNNDEIFSSLTKNKSLFLLWKDINQDYLILKKRNDLILKIILKFTTLFNFKKISEKINLKIHNISKIKMTRKIKINEIKYIFLTYNNHSFWPQSLKNFCNNIQIVRFPEAQHIWDYNSKYNLKFTKYEKLISDMIILPYKYDVFSKNFLKKKQIINCGILKYEKKWSSKVRSIKDKKLPSKFFLVVTRPPFDGKNDKKYFSTESFEYMLRSIFNLAKNFPSYNIVFKTHPNGTEKKLITDLAIKNKFENYFFSNDHLFNLGAKAKICISFYTSGILDLIYVNKNVIEFWLGDIDNLDLIKNKKLHKWQTIYAKNKLVRNVENYKELLDMTNKILFKNNTIKQKKINLFFNENKKINKELNITKF